MRSISILLSASEVSSTMPAGNSFFKLIYS
jgi:hypothetical protein